MSFKFKLMSPDVSITFRCMEDPSMSRIMQSSLSAIFPPLGFVTVNDPPGATVNGVTVKDSSSSSRHKIVTASKNTIGDRSSQNDSSP